MKFPVKKITVGPMAYTVVFTPDLTVGQDRCSGAIDPAHEKIHFDATMNMGSRYAATTVMHEAMHAMLQTIGVDDSEAMVEKMSLSYCDFIRQNPELFKYFLKVFNEVE